MIIYFCDIWKVFFKSRYSDTLSQSFENFEIIGRLSHLSSYRMLSTRRNRAWRETGVFQGMAFNAGSINIFRPIREQTSTQWRHSFTPYFRHICVLFPANEPREYIAVSRSCVSSSNILRDSNEFHPKSQETPNPRISIAGNSVYLIVGIQLKCAI